MPRSDPAPRGPVALLHGLARSRRSMGAAGRWLERLGFETACLGYPSRRLPLQELARRVGDSVEDRFGGQPERIHFVTHSLGGIVLRRLLADDLRDGCSWRPGRIVMLAPPNRGSRLAERLGDAWWFRRFFGPAGQELRAGPGCVLPSLPVPPKVLILAGMRPVGLYRLALRGRPGGDLDNDGTVGVDETVLEGAPAPIPVGGSHTFIMNSREALEVAAGFLASGRIARPEAGIQSSSPTRMPR